MTTDTTEVTHDHLDLLADRDPLALRDLAWKLLDERDRARADLGDAEARGYRKAIEHLRATNETSDEEWYGSLAEAGDWLEATEATR